ncbi:hypothetical protein MTO96_038985 [Rhipicephalus appendiculatus]
MDKEMSRCSPGLKKLSESMKPTRSSRRSWMKDWKPTTAQILEKYPALSNAEMVAQKRRWLVFGFGVFDVPTTAGPSTCSSWTARLHRCESPPSLDAVHFGRRGHVQDRSALLLSVVVAMMAALSVGFALAVIFKEHKSVASVEPLTDFAAYRGQPLNKAEVRQLTEPRTKLKTSPGASRITVERDTTTTSGSSTRSPHTESTSTTK